MTPRPFVAAVAALTAVVVPVLPAGAAPPRTEEHCVIRVIGQHPDGELVTTEPACYPTFTQAMRATGVPGADTLRPGAGSAAVQRVNAASATTIIIGTHYDGLGFSGASTTVSGGDCSGGWLNVSATWNNRIRSTYNGCPVIDHFDGTGLTGDHLATSTPGGNLGVLDQRTTSIQYRAS